MIKNVSTIILALAGSFLGSEVATRHASSMNQPAQISAPAALENRAHVVRNSPISPKPVFVAPAALVGQFYQAIDKHNFKTAYALLSNDFRQSVPFDDFVAAYRTTKSVNCRIVKVSGLKVTLKLYAVDSENGTDTRDRVFGGHWQIIHQHGKSVLNEGRFHTLADSDVAANSQRQASDSATQLDASTHNSPSESQMNLSEIPEIARTGLSFMPATTSTQVNSESILNRTLAYCNLGEYIGSQEIPGSLVLHSKPHGWTKIDWNIADCNPGGDGKSSFTLSFRLSADSSHVASDNLATALIINSEE